MLITIYSKKKLDLNCLESHGLVGFGKTYYPKALIEGIDLNNDALRLKVVGVGYRFLGDRIDSPICLYIQGTHLFFRMSEIQKIDVTD